TLMLLLDLSPSMEAGFGVWSLRDAAARLAALLVVTAQRFDDPVGWVAFGGKVSHAVPPRKGVRHGFGVVRDALSLPHSGQGLGLHAALERVAQLVQRRSTVFVLSDFLQEGWQESLSLCARHHNVVAIPLLPPEWWSPPSALVRFSSFSGQESRLVDGRSPAVQSAWRSAADERLQMIEESVRRAGADCVTTLVPYEASLQRLVTPLQAYFEQRKRVRGSG
ncbi:MAG: hypothetical protein MK209_08910, partial [Planctomycetes bacterium]|nr:hypothetical protein [Planctomycetota bacterium]